MSFADTRVRPSTFLHGCVHSWQARAQSLSRGRRCHRAGDRCGAHLAAGARLAGVVDTLVRGVRRRVRGDRAGAPCGHPATELLHREVDDRALEQVAASATGPLLRRFVHDTASCAALAAELDTPNGPDRAEDDVTDAITDLVDWQIARRFDQ